MGSLNDVHIFGGIKQQKLYGNFEFFAHKSCIAWVRNIMAPVEIN